MFDANKLLNRALAGGAASGFVGGLLGGGAVGLLGTKKGRKMAKSALKVGGIAAVGALAYHAYTKYKAGQADTSHAVEAAAPGAPEELLPPPLESGFLPDPSDKEATQSVGVVLIRSMIAAARADGEIDAVEGQRLFGQMDRLELDSEEKAFLLQELSRPVDMGAIAGAAKTPELAAEIYTASLMAIDVSNAAEVAYLQLLASRLGLEPGLVEELRKAVESQTVAAGA